MTHNSDSGLSWRKFLIASDAAGLAGLAGCTENNAGGGSSGGDSEGEDPSGDRSNELSGAIDIAGSLMVSPPAIAMAERFQTKHSEVNISLQFTGPGDGFANYFCTGRTDFSGASRSVKGEKQDQCENNGVIPVELKVTIDALTVIANNDNGFFGKGLTVEQLQTIFSAESTPTAWLDVNSEWPDEEIEIYGPTNASGTYDYFIKTIIEGESPGRRQDYSATEQNYTIIQSVEGSEHAIDYLSFAYYSENTDVVQTVPTENGVGESVEPSFDTALSGEYNPLSRPPFAYPTRESFAEEYVAEFAHYWIENSANCETTASEVGYVPLNEDDQQEMLDTPNAAIEKTNQPLS